MLEAADHEGVLNVALPCLAVFRGPVDLFSVNALVEREFVRAFVAQGVDNGSSALLVGRELLAGAVEVPAVIGFPIVIAKFWGLRHAPLPTSLSHPH